MWIRKKKKKKKDCCGVVWWKRKRVEMEVWKYLIHSKTGCREKVRCG